MKKISILITGPFIGILMAQSSQAANTNSNAYRNFQSNSGQSNTLNTNVPNYTLGNNVGTNFNSVPAANSPFSSNSANPVSQNINNAAPFNSSPVSNISNPNNFSNATLDAPLANAQLESAPVQERLTSIVYRGAPLMDVIRSIAESANINIAFTQSVKNDPLTIQLDNVSYDVALATILDLNNLGATRENNILRIDTKDNIKKTIEERLKLDKDIRRTQVPRTVIMQINYAKATQLSGLLTSMLKEYSTDDRFSVQADDRTNKILITGIEEAIVRAKALVTNLDKRKQQILIEARVIEAATNFNKDLNIDWGSKFALDANRGLGQGWVFPSSVKGNLGGAGSLGPAGGVSLTPNTNRLNASFGSINGMFNLDAILTAYEKEAMISIIASPKVVVQDQETSSILNSEQKSRTAISNDSVQTRTSSANLSLNVTPQITHDGGVELAIKVSRDTPGEDSNSPNEESVTKRDINTKLIVNNGDTAVIGGLFTIQKSKTEFRVPFLGKIPIIGWFFRNKSEVSNRSELMVLLTPRILPNSSPGGAPAGGNGAMSNFGGPPNNSGSYDNSGFNNSSVNSNTGINAAPNNSLTTNSVDLRANNSFGNLNVPQNKNNQTSNMNNFSNPAGANNAGNTNFGNNNFNNNKNNKNSGNAAGANSFNNFENDENDSSDDDF